MLPSLSDASAVIKISAGAIRTELCIGAVRVAEGGAFGVSTKIPTVTEVEAFSSSYETAISEYAPAETLFHENENGKVGSTPSKLFPSKNSTFRIFPSASEAAAEITISLPGRNLVLSAGCVISTVGGTFAAVKFA